MNTRFNRLLLFVFSLVCMSFLLIQQEKPTVYIIGDSTVRNTTTPNGLWGWGSVIDEFLDTNRIRISNQAMAGRSTRTFIKEQRWEKVLATLKKGDYVIMQFGHNEGAKPDTSKAGYRGVLRGIGNDTIGLTWPDGSRETVHSYGWYLGKLIQEAKAKGAIPIVCSMIPRNIFKDGKVERGDKNFGKWARESAEANGAFFVDLNAITADKYDEWGPEKVKSFFPGDHTHTNENGARENARSVIEGIKKTGNCTLLQYIR